MSRKTLMLAMAATMMAMHNSDNYYRYGKRKQYTIPDGGNGFSHTPTRFVYSRQLREFSIKGHKIMAYSKKDAITRLKHQKLI